MSPHETTHAVSVGDIAPIDHAEALRLARTEHRRLGDVVDAIGPDDWARPTDCAEWTVRDLVGHVVGTFMASASLVEMVRQQIRTKRRGGTVDDYTAQQVERVAHLDPAALVQRFHGLEEKAVTGRGRMPAFVRDRATIPQEVNGAQETWTFSYLLGTILLRDAFMHRIDLSRAIDRPLEVDSAHDGRIVADVVAEWGRRHGQPVEVVLSGPAGGRFRQGSPSGRFPTLELDAIEFCRITSGRAPATHDLLKTEVPF